MLRLLGAGALVLVVPAAALAQPADADDESDVGLVVGEESPELRTLRLAEEELFGGRPAELPPPEPTAVPSVLTSEVPAASQAPHAEGQVDMSWLRGLRSPDIPVRWDERVVRYLEFFRDDPRGRSIITSWLRRERRYGAMIRARLRGMGLPEDLLYVAMVESGFDPSARSYAGAVGMWQFVEGTGEEYGLEQNHWVDERMDPLRATEAGARYLADLRRRFGSWELAMAAYNMGYGALLRAIRKFNSNDYWLLARLESGLPFETTVYVAKIMACAIVGRNPERFGFAELERDPALEFATVEVPGGTSLARVARAAQVDADRVTELNPHLKRNRTPAGVERYSVRIPAASAETFARQWTRMQPRHPASRPYVMRFGEMIADVADRFRTTEAAIRSLNDLADGEEPGAGTRLLVPAVEPREPTRTEPVVVAVPEERFVYPDRRRVFYRVTSNDTLPEIAEFFSVSLDDLRRWNNVTSDAALQRGMLLQLFVAPQVDLARALVLAEDDVRILVVGTDEFFDYHEQQRGRVRLRYRVQPGDTLTAIASRFDLSVGDVARINRFARDVILRAGQEIIVYAARPAAQAAPAAPPAPGPGAATPAAATPAASDD